MGTREGEQLQQNTESFYTQHRVPLTKKGHKPPYCRMPLVARNSYCRPNSRNNQFKSGKRNKVSSHLRWSNDTYLTLQLMARLSLKDGGEQQ
jgi:hypothetical protein